MITALPETQTILGILAVFLISGTVKGSLGIGFPAVAMSIFPIIIEPALAVALLALPILVTNGTQFLTVKGWPAIIRRHLVAAGSLIVTIFVIVQFVDDVPARWINILVGLSLAVFSLASLFKLDLKVNEGNVWQLLVGITSGLFGGVSAVKAPIMIYAVALKLPREEFIAVAGFLFFCGGVGMVGGITTGAMMSGPMALLSLGGVVAALAGFRVGAILRQRLSDRMFRLLLLWVILALGVRLIVVNVI